MKTGHNSTIKRRMRRIEKELSQVSNRLGELSGDEKRGAHKRDSSPSGSSLAPPRPSLRDERFAEYLASNVRTGRPLRHEKRLQRNKAIFMAVFVGLILLWILLQHVL